MTKTGFCLASDEIFFVTKFYHLIFVVTEQMEILAERFHTKVKSNFLMHRCYLRPYYISGISDY